MSNGTGKNSNSHSYKMAEFDLTGKFLQHVDRHLGIPMLQHLSSTGLFNEQDLLKAQYELAKGTSMVGFTAELFSQAFPGQAAPAELKKQEQETNATNERLAKEVEHALDVIEDPNVLSALKSDKQQNLQWLEQNHQLTLPRSTRCTSTATSSSTAATTPRPPRTSTTSASSASTRP